jgi:hypothetical protein
MTRRPRGPGFVERTIEQTFTANPDQAFTTEELARLCYRFSEELCARRSERVAVLRAANKVAARLHWSSHREALTRSPSVVFFNKQSVMSYARARLKADPPEFYRDIEAELRPGGGHHEYIEPGGAWSDFVEEFKAEIAGVPPAPEIAVRRAAAMDEIVRRLDAAMDKIAERPANIGAQKVTTPSNLDPADPAEAARQILARGHNWAAAIRDELDRLLGGDRSAANSAAAARASDPEGR